MEFENISKVEFNSIGKSVVLNNAVIIETSSNKHAEFIANCFNLQQRYDISKIEEVVSILVNLEAFLSFNITPNADNMKEIKKDIEQLLKEIKK